jgi:tetratricopeptide (TPR) repeat protein
MDHAAIRLFVERATLALGRFELTDETAGDVAEICRRLDGIALAIELAVPRLKMLKPAELLVRLKDRFRLLTGGDRGALPRQQTLRALIDWSWDLLSENERLTLQRLSVFADAITLDDATRVIADDPLEDWEVFDLIASLLEKSLVTPLAETAGASRYRLLETTRAYGLEKLKEGGEEPAFRRRLAQFLIERFRAADAAYPTTASEPWLAEYGPELENLRAGLDWCFGPGGDRALGVELVGLTLTFWEELSLLPERKRWLDLAASALDPVTPPGVAGRILLGRSAAIWLGDRQHLDDLMRAIDLLRAAGDPLWLGRALSAAGRAFARPGDVEQAEPYFRDAEKLLRPLGRTRSLSNLLNARAITCEFAGDPDAARKLYEENLAMERALGNPKVVALVSSNLAELEFSGGHLREAIQRARDAETVCRAGGNLVFLSLILTNLTGYLLADDAVAEARTAGLEALRLNVSLNQDYYIVICLEHLALVHALSNDLERAARLAGHGEAFYGEADRTREATEAATWTKLTGLLDAALPIDRLATLKAEGAGWDRARAAEVALD